MKASALFFSSLVAAAAMSTGTHAATLTDAVLSIDAFTSSAVTNLESDGWTISNITGTDTGVFTSTKGTQATIAAGTSGASLTTNVPNGKTARYTYSAIFTVDASVFDGSTNNAVLLSGTGTGGVTGAAVKNGNLAGAWNNSVWGTSISDTASYANDAGLITIGITFNDSGTTFYILGKDGSTLMSGLKGSGDTTVIGLVNSLTGVSYSNLYWFNTALSAADMTSAMTTVGSGYVWAGTSDGNVWDTTSTNWLKDSASSAFTSDSSVIFGNAADNKSVVINSAITAADVSVMTDYSFTINEGGSLTADSIALASGATMNIAGAGTLAVTTLSGTGALSGTGTIQFGSLSGFALTGTTKFSNWTGSVVLKSISTTSTTAFNPNTYGVAGSTVVLDGVTGSNFYFAQGTNSALTVAPDIEIASGGLTLNNGYSTTVYTFSGSLSGDGTWKFSHSGARQQYVFTGDVSGFSGTLNLANTSLVTFGNGGTGVTGSVSGTGTITMASSDAVLTYNYSNDVSASTTLAGGMSVVKQGAGSLTLTGENTYTGGTTVSAGTLIAGSDSAFGAGTVSVSSAGKLEIASGVTLALSSETNTLSGTVLVDSGATLNLSGSTINLANAITNSGTVTVDSDTTIALAMTGTDNTYTVITNADSGSITGWNSDMLSISNFRKSDGTAFSGRSTVDVATAGVVKIAQIAWDLYWKGDTTGTWDTSTATNWGLDSASGKDTAFVNGDNVTFDTSGNVAVTVSSDTMAGTVKIASGTKLTLTNQQNLTADSINIAEGATLDLGSFGDNVNVVHNLTGTGTVSFSKTGDNHGHTVNLGTDFAGTVNYSGTLNPTNATFGSEDATVHFTNVDFWSDQGNATIAQTLKFSGTGNKTRGENDTLNLTGDISFSEGATFTVAKGTLNISGAVTDGNFTQTGGTLNFTGTGTKNIDSLTQTSGTLTISGGTVSVTDNGKITATLSSLAAGANLTLAGTGDESAITLSGSKTISGNLTIGNATVSASGSVFNYDISQSQKITLNKGGTLVLGSNRQSFNEYVSVELNGGTISGNGDQHGAMDFYKANTITVKSDSEISAVIRMRGPDSGGSGNLTITVDDGAVLTVSGSINKKDESNTTRQIIKSGAGSMKLTADNSYFAAGFNVEAGTLVAANEKALGTGTTTVAKDAKLGLVAGTTVSGVTGGVELAKGAKLVIDMTGQTASSAVEDTLALDLVVGSALKYNGNAFDLDCTTLITDGVVVLDNLDSSLTSWVKKLSYASGTNTLTLTLTIPEPSTFGLLAGVGALAFVAARRRRRAK